MLCANHPDAAPDYPAAHHWYEKAAAQGMAYAQCNLGVLYENGLGVAPDIDIAHQWYEKAAAQGDNEVQHLLQRLQMQIQARQRRQRKQRKQRK